MVTCIASITALAALAGAGTAAGARVAVRSASSSPLCQPVGPLYYVGTWQGSGAGFGGPVSGNVEIDLVGTTGSVTFVYGTLALPVTIALSGVSFTCSGTTLSWASTSGSPTFSFTGTASTGGDVIWGSFTDSSGDAGTLTVALATSQLECSAVATCSTGDLTAKATPVGVTVDYPGCATPGSTSIRATSRLPQSATTPAGHTLDGIVLSIAKPAGSTACPFLLHFAVNAAVEGESTAVPVFEGGQLLPTCTGGTPPSNPPCVVMPESAGNAETTATVYSPDPPSSFWEFGATGTAPPAVSTRSPLPRATVGQAYEAVLDAIGGSAPYSWSVVGGHLPAGLALSAGGVISGTPTGAGKSRFTVEVTDAADRTAMRSFSLKVG